MPICVCCISPAVFVDTDVCCSVVYDSRRQICATVADHQASQSLLHSVVLRDVRLDERMQMSRLVRNTAAAACHRGVVRNYEVRHIFRIKKKNKSEVARLDRRTDGGIGLRWQQAHLPQPMGLHGSTLSSLSWSRRNPGRQ